MMDSETIAAAVRAERLSLCDFLERLRSEEWSVASLCSGWNVQEVVAHLTVTTRATMPMVFKEALKARGNFDRMASNVARRRAAAFRPDELLQQLRASAVVPSNAGQWPVGWPPDGRSGPAPRSRSPT